MFATFLSSPARDRSTALRSHLAPVKTAVFILAAFFSLAVSDRASAEQIRIVTDSFPPFSLDGPKQGFVVEATLEAVKRAGFTPKLEFMPWRRAQTVAQEEKDVVIIPFSRSPDREPLYNWIVKITDSPYGFITMKQPAINSFDAAKALAKIGVGAGTNYEELLVKGTSKAQADPAKPEQNVEKIRRGRIDAWFDGFYYASYFYNKAYPGERLVFGTPVGASEAYIAAGKQFPQAHADKIRAAVESLIADGTLDATKKTYLDQQRW